MFGLTIGKTELIGGEVAIGFFKWFLYNKLINLHK